MMRWDHSEILDDLLSRWHSWMQGARVTRGYDRESSGTGQYRVSRQYDDVNGALDSDLDDARSKAVDIAVNTMEHPHRTAIYIDARNLCTGLAVWDSPRLPLQPHERERIRTEARAMLCDKLLDAGVI